MPEKQTKNGNHKENICQIHTKGKQEGKWSVSLQKKFSKTQRKVRGKEGPKVQDKQKAINKMAIRNPSILITTLNVNGLSFPIQRHRFNRFLKNQDPTLL